MKVNVEGWRIFHAFCKFVQLRYSMLFSQFISYRVLSQCKKICSIWKELSTEMEAMAKETKLFPLPFSFPFHELTLSNSRYQMLTIRSNSKSIILEPRTDQYDQLPAKRKISSQTKKRNFFWKKVSQMFFVGKKRRTFFLGIFLSMRRRRRRRNNSLWSTGALDITPVFFSTLKKALSAA